MGVIRKAASISTLGLINFRSKKELVKRAEKERDAAQTDLERAKLARSALDEQVSATEKRARKAELAALQQAKANEKQKGSRRKRRKDKANQAIDAVEDFVSTTAPVVEQRAKDLSRRGRKAAAKATKQAEEAAAKAQKQAKKHGKRAKEKLDEVSTAAGEFVSEHRGADG